jgi:hypothetical protein
VVIDGVDPATSLGLGLTFNSGAACGRERFCVARVDDVLLSTAVNAPVFDGVRAGDAVHVDNRKWLAFCYLHRHQVDETLAESRALLVDGIPVYPQRPRFPMSSMYSITRAAPHTGEFVGKMIIVNHLLDDYVWPNGAIFYSELVRDRRGADTDDQFRLWFVENATHLPPAMLPPTERARLVDAAGCTQQAIHDSCPGCCPRSP